MTLRARQVAVALGAAALLGACAGVLGIEERRLRGEDLDAGPQGAGGSAAGGVSGQGGDTQGTGSAEAGPPPSSGGAGSGGTTGTCAPQGVPPDCRECFCSQCSPRLQEHCTRSDCIPAAACVVQSGCGSPAICAQASECGAELAEIPEPNLLLECLTRCAACSPASGCQDGTGCTTPMGTRGVCTGGTCAPCAAAAGTRDPACDAAYGGAQGCCGPDGACTACFGGTDCVTAGDGAVCTTAPTANGRGVCVGGICYQCNDPPGTYSNDCMMNAGGTTLCCSAANQCVTCPTAGDCSTQPNGAACEQGPAMPGLCYGGACRTCTAPAGRDPMCLDIYGPAQECCNAAKTGCAPCTTGSCGACPAGHVCTGVTCGPCTMRGLPDPACSAAYGAASACCSSTGLCGTCGVPSTSELVDAVPPVRTVVDIASVPDAIAWNVVDVGGGPGTLRGARYDVLPSVDLYLGGAPSGPLGSDAQGTFFWAYTGGLRSYRVVPPIVYRDVLPVPDAVSGVTASSSYVFWTASNGAVYRASPDGVGGPTEIARVPFPGTRIAVSGNNVFWAAATQVYQTSINGGAVTVVAGVPAGNVVDFAVSNGYVFWLAASGASGTVRMQATAGGVASSLAEPQFFGEFGGMVLNGPNDILFTADSGLYRLRLFSGATTYALGKLADLQAPVGRLAYSNTHVYFIQAGGREVWRIPRPPP